MDRSRAQHRAGAADRPAPSFSPLQDRRPDPPRRLGRRQLSGRRARSHDLICEVVKPPGIFAQPPHVFNQCVAAGVRVLSNSCIGAGFKMLAKDGGQVALFSLASSTDGYDFDTVIVSHDDAVAITRGVSLT
jgi:hypothetical protein